MKSLIKQRNLYAAVNDLGGKIHLIPLVFIAHLFCSETNVRNQYTGHQPLLKWLCYECFIFLKSMIFWLTVQAASHHSDMINSFIMLD